MKYIIALVLIGVLSVGKSDAQKKIGFVYPEDSVTEASKKGFVINFNQGKVLYNITCARCHNVKDGKKEVIPDFSLPQLLDYEMRFYYPEHKDRLNDTQITDEEMKKIILFLMFKEKSGVNAHK